MDAPTDVDLLLDMIESVALDVLAQIGDKPHARSAFIKRFVVLAQKTTEQAEAARQAGPH